MEVSLNANMCDSETLVIAQELRDPFKSLSQSLSGSYGGIVEHLWIDFELVQSHAQLRAPRTFRFQKRVAPPAMLKGLGQPHYHNVGHYSVRPDFATLFRTPVQQVAAYALKLIYQSTIVLAEKQKRLGGFNASAFRETFSEGCRNLGYEIQPRGVAR